MAGKKRRSLNHPFKRDRPRFATDFPPVPAAEPRTVAGSSSMAESSFCVRSHQDRCSAFATRRRSFAEPRVPAVGAEDFSGTSSAARGSGLLWPFSARSDRRRCDNQVWLLCPPKVKVATLCFAPTARNGRCRSSQAVGAYGLPRSTEPCVLLGFRHGRRGSRVAGRGPFHLGESVQRKRPIATGQC